jgi:hypothetical protein
MHSHEVMSMKIKHRKRKSKSKKIKRSGKKSKPRGLKLVKIVKSPKKEKKLRAYFNDGSHTDFGAAGMSDYTKHKDEARKQRYMSRHKRNESWNSPKTAGSLSRYVLWNKPSLRGSIADYKRRFNL